MIGSAFGHYRILDKIGQGGMGEVYLAEDTTLRRKVALKFLPPTLAEDPEARERFLLEAQAAAALSHPNICVIHEVGETEGRPFIAMEYVEGETLQQKIRSGTLEKEEILSIMTQVAAGLEEAHAKGIIHRDIKSSNVMVTARGQAKVMDFGLAKVRGGPALTRTHTTLGTVAYMSPEQAAGDEVDHRTDLWSAGVVLYEVLTGELPFQGERETAVVYHILNEPPKPFKDLEPPIPSELRRVVTRALNKNPEARYASAGEMLADLRKYEEALRAEAAGVFSVRILARRLRRPSVAVPTVLALVALALASVRVAERRGDARWAREVAIPQIRQMIEENDLWRYFVAPYRLAAEAEAILGDDPELADLLSQVSLNINVTTDPPGATVYMKEYATPDSAWELLGITPLEGIRVPIGVFRWKLEKEGFETVEALASTWKRRQEGPGVVPDHLVRRLDPVGEIPEGMVRVPGTVTPEGELEDSFLDRYEVTNREYRAFMDAGGYIRPELWTHPFVEDGQNLTWEEGIGEFVDQTGLPGPGAWEGGGFPGDRADYPVSGVSWYEAAAYAEWAGKSLPTDIHWQIARGAFTPIVSSPQFGGAALIAPFSNLNSAGPVAVGSLPSLTSFGNYDLAGNVREWCWNETAGGARVIRGGAWDDNPYMFGNRSGVPPMDRSVQNGFRLALYPHPETMPDAVYQPQAFPQARDFYAEQPVSDAVFQAYRDRFSYDPTPLNAEVESRTESPRGWIRERVSFDAAYGGERITGYLHLPRNAEPPYSAVVYFPGSQALGAGDREHLEDWPEFNTFVSFLPAAGRAVLYPAYKGTFDRFDPAVPPMHIGDGTRAYADFQVQVIQDFMRSVDYLESREDVDVDRLAYYGMSWGGVLGFIIPAVEDRMATAVLLSGGMLPDPNRKPRPEADPRNYLERIRTPILMMNGRYDNILGLEQGIRPAFDLLGTPDADKRLLLYDTDHIPPRTEYIKETLAWLDKYLGPVRR